jgi:hypothetical protein
VGGIAVANSGCPTRNRRLTMTVIISNITRMTPTAPSPQAAQERLAEAFGRLSQGIAANSGGDRLSTLLVSLINLIVQALRALALAIPETTAPSDAEASRTLPTPQRPSGTPVRTAAPKAVRAFPPGARKPRLEQRPAPEAGEAPESRLRVPATTLPRIPRPGARKRRAQAGTRRRYATAPPRRPPKNRALAPTDVVRPYRYE